MGRGYFEALNVMDMPNVMDTSDYIHKKAHVGVCYFYLLGEFTVGVCYLSVSLHIRTRQTHTHTHTHTHTPTGLTLYPWLMPLMNCCGGGFQVKRMVVELIARTFTVCGGAVGTTHKDHRHTHTHTHTHTHVIDTAAFTETLTHMTNS